MRAKRVPKGLAPLVMSGPNGYGPPDLRSAYKVAGLTSGGRTVAIVDAYDDPNAAADLGVYRKQYGLSACTTANGCFKKVNEIRPGQPAAHGGPGLGRGGEPRPGHGVVDLSRLPHHAGRGHRRRHGIPDHG